ncbi:hypothetical protein ACVI1L_006272 [Bradyrhizobium sp. USDA 4516]
MVPVQHSRANLLRLESGALRGIDWPTLISVSLTPGPHRRSVPAIGEGLKPEILSAVWMTELIMEACLALTAFGESLLGTVLLSRAAR